MKLCALKAHLKLDGMHDVSRWNNWKNHDWPSPFSTVRISWFVAKQVHIRKRCVFFKGDREPGQLEKFDCKSRFKSICSCYPFALACDLRPLFLFRGPPVVWLWFSLSLSPLGRLTPAVLLLEFPTPVSARDSLLTVQRPDKVFGRFCLKMTFIHPLFIGFVLKTFPCFSASSFVGVLHCWISWQHSSYFSTPYCWSPSTS